MYAPAAPEGKEIHVNVPLIQNPYAQNSYEHENHHSNEIMCRNCHESEGNDFIAPCKCSGSIKFVHRKCLDEWRLVSPNPQSFTTCDVCGFDYHMEEVPSSEKECVPSWLKFATFVGFDIGIVLGGWQLIVLGIILLTVLVDMDQQRYFIPIMKEISEVSGVLADILWGNAWFFFCLGTIAIIFGAVALLLKICGADCCGGDKEEVNMYSHRYHYHSYSSLDWFFFWYIWSFSPIPRGGYYGGPGCCVLPAGDPTCCLDCVSIGGGSFTGLIPKGGDSKECGAIILVLLIAVFLIIMFIGMIVGIVIFVIYFSAVIQKRLHILDKKTKMAQRIIADMNGKI